MFIFCSNGQLDNSDEYIYTDDTPLSQIGILESEETGKYLQNNSINSSYEKLKKKFDYVISSPSLCTSQTATYIMKYIETSDNKIYYNDKLTEIIVSDNINCQSIKNNNKLDLFDRSIFENETIVENFNKYSKNETVESFIKKMYEFLDYLKKLYDKKVLIVTHKGIIQSLIWIITGTCYNGYAKYWPYKTKKNYGKHNCLLSFIEYTNKSPICKTIALSKKKFILRMPFCNHHLDILYNDLRPLIIWFTPLLCTECPEELMKIFNKYGDIYIHIPKFISFDNFVIQDLDYNVNIAELHNELKNKCKYYEHRKIICIGIDDSCKYAKHFIAKNMDKCNGGIFFGNPDIVYEQNLINQLLEYEKPGKALYNLLSKQRNDITDFELENLILYIMHSYQPKYNIHVDFDENQKNIPNKKLYLYTNIFIDINIGKDIGIQKTQNLHIIGCATTKELIYNVVQKYDNILNNQLEMLCM